MGINLSNFLSSKSKNTRMIDFQDLEHVDGLSISVGSANLYKDNRDDLAMFYFRDGANHASVYTQSKIISENIKWNLNQKCKKVYSLLVNTRNANAFTGKEGYEGLKKISLEISKELNKKQELDEDNPKKISPKEIMFGCTGTIGETFPYQKILNQIPNLISKIKYTQNKFIWMKAALGIMTTDTKPKLAMEECKIGNKKIKIYGIAKGSGMIHPNMATTLAYVFTDAKLSNEILSRLLKKILLSLAKRVVSDGEGSSKFVAVNVKKCKSEIEAKNIAFSIANSPLVKTAIAGEDPNWGRIIMAIGKAGSKINLKKLSIKFGDLKIVQDGKLHQSYDEKKTSEYMKNENIEFNIEIFTGSENFTVYTMDFTKKYVEINADYRS
jgi:glutamate N-acetyltransferase/amino-acid N-acetyltransferase